MPASKKALLRYQILNKLLQNRFGYTILELTDKVNEEMENLESEGSKSYTVSDRMIRIDLENMMDIFPIEIKNENGRFFYENQEDSINNINLREEEKMAIELAIGVFARYNGTPIFDKFSDVITRILTSSVLRKINTTDTSKYIHLAEIPENSGVEWLERIYNAIVEKKAIRLQYKSFGEKSSIKTISPYLLKEYRNKWYMIAKLHGKEDENVLIFKLSRIQSIEISKEDFLFDSIFDADKYFKYTLGVFHRHDEDPIKVRLRITGKGIIKLFSEDKVHLTQQIFPLNENECELTMTVYNSPELETFILGYSEHITVLEPEDLRNRIFNRIINAQKNYQKWTLE